MDSEDDMHDANDVESLNDDSTMAKLKMLPFDGNLRNHCNHVTKEKCDFLSSVNTEEHSEEHNMNLSRLCPELPDESFERDGDDMEDLAVFKRPFYLEFLNFCIERFNVAFWSSTFKKYVDRVVDYLMEDTRQNTLLLDDSPYKKILNPIKKSTFTFPYNSIFPHIYNYENHNDLSLEVLKRFVTIEKEIVQIEGSVQSSETEGLPINLKGKRDFIAGVADDNGYGWPIAKSLAAAGAKILLGIWIPFLTTLRMYQKI
ncbi:unnamed protein product [Vicia faba]|uniref:FCP1 homology domain-containing protein n=1 Tax=Vicia faba TaxID=3906 RepID=A0AAV0YGD9_VICFA|nr:unnamed protein product [Vicia faba]